MSVDALSFLFFTFIFIFNNPHSTKHIHVAFTIQQTTTPFSYLEHLYTIVVLFLVLVPFLSPLPCHVRVMLPEPAPKSLPFVLVCDLLNELDDLVNREDYLLPRYLKERRNTAVIRWFGSHCRVLERCEKTAEHVLAMLQPTERRKDCVYGFDTEDLERIIARALHLPLEYLPELQRWRLGAPRLDLGACVEEIISKYPVKLPHLVAL